MGRTYNSLESEGGAARELIIIISRIPIRSTQYAWSLICEGRERRAAQEKKAYLAPAQWSDARIKEFWFHVGAVIRLAFHVVDTLGMPHLHA